MPVTQHKFRAARKRLPLAIGALLLCTQIDAQTAGATDQMRSYNRQLSEKTLTARDTERILSERALALYSLMESDPAAALTMALPARDVERLRGIVPGRVDLLESSGKWQGQVAATVEDDFARGLSRTRWRLRTSGANVELYFAGTPPSLMCERELKIAGVRLGNRLVASGAAVTGPAPADCTTTGVQQTAVLLVSFPGVPLPADQTPGAYHDILFGAGSRSVSGYYKESSHGRLSVAGSVFGPFTLDANYSCDDLQGIQDAAIRAADGVVDVTRYSRIFIVHPNVGCRHEAAGTLGCRTLASPSRGAFNASVVWYQASAVATPAVLAHELGHNLGLLHAETLFFPGKALGARRDSASPANHSVGDQGDSVMGVASVEVQFNAQQKLGMGWITSPGNVQTVEGNGTFQLKPIELATSGLQAIRVRRGTGGATWLWLESRQSGNPGALIHYEDATSYPATYLLDFHPETANDFRDAALAAGQTWNDPNSNLSITVNSADSTGVGVTVSYVNAVVVSPPSLTFASPPASTTKQTQNLSLSGGAFSYTSSVTYGPPAVLSVGQTWLTVNPASGSVPGTPGVTVDPTGLPPGIYNATITFTIAGASNSPISVPVILTIPDTNIAGYWTFDTAYINGNVVLDSSGNNLNGTLVNATSIPGVVGQALSFSGPNSYVAVPDSAGTELTHDLTIATWIRTQNNSQVQDFIGKYDYTGNETGYLLQMLPSGVVNLHLGGFNIVGSRDIADTTVINDGQWHHVAVVIGLGQSITFYIDGKLSSSSARSTFPAGTSATLYLGTSPGALNGQPFTGSLDEVQIYSRQLSATEVLLLLGGATPAITSISPTSTPQGAPVTVTVTGSGFLPSARVLVPAAAAVFPRVGILATTFISSTQLSAVVVRDFTQGPGPVTLQVFNVFPGGVGSNTMTLTVTPVTPTINTLTPSSITAGASDFTLTVDGSNFVTFCLCEIDPLTGAELRWNGTSLTTLTNSGNNTATRVQALVPASLVANPGTATITVTNPGNITSNPLTFTIGPTPPSLTLICSQSAGPTQTDVPYSNACTVGGATSPTAVTYSISAGALPAGLTLTTSAGVNATISGTPTTAGPYSYTLTVKDNITNQTASQTFSGTISSTQQGGLAGYWTCDTADITGNIMLDRSGNGLNGTLLNTTSAPGKINQALCFSGANSNVTIPDNAGLRLSHDLTLATWIKTTNNTQKQDFISKYDFSGQETGYMLQMLPNGTVNLRLGGNNVASGSRDASDSTVINDGQFHHVAVVIPIGGNVQFYIDGKLTTTTTQKPAAASNSALLYLGTFPNAFNGLPFVGCLDDVRVYSRSLSAAEIAILATATGPLITSVSPAATPEGSPFTVTVNGSGFAPNSIVLVVPQAFTGTPGELRDLAHLQTTFVSPNQLTAVVPVDFTQAPGSTITFQVFNGPTNGTGSNTMGVTVTPIIPTITSLSPSTAAAGGAGFTLTVIGTNFLPPCTCLPDPETGAIVYWNGVGLMTRWFSANQVTADVPANLIANAGTVNITVANVPGIMSAPATFDVISGGGAPLTLTCPPNQFIQPNVPFTATCTTTGGTPPYRYQVSDAAPFPVISGNTISFTFTLNAGNPIELFQVGVSDSTNPPFHPMTLTFYAGDYVSPSGSWPFDTVTNGITPDYSGNGINGQVTNASLVPGKVNQALSFSGAGSFVTIPDNVAFGLTHDLTLATWIKTTNTTQKQDFLSKYDFTGSESGYMLQILPSGVVNLHVGGANLVSGSRDVSDTTAINDGQFHHVAVVITLGQTVAFYIDGQLSSTQPMATSAWRNLAPVFAGTFTNPYNGLPFVGVLDELRIFNRALTALEVSELAHAI